MSAVAPRTNGRTRAPRVADVEELRPRGLADALFAFAAEAPKLIRNEPGQIQSRRYMYTTLDSLLDDVVPLLLKHQLVWSARVTLADGHPAALYRMEHLPSREADEWTGPLPCVDPGPQALGSAITYMRRYTLQAYLNLAPGEDDDGAAASMLPTCSQHAGPMPVDRYAEAEARAEGEPRVNPGSAQPTAAPAKPAGRPATVKQRNMLRAKAKGAGLSEGQLANVVIAANGELPRQWRSDEHASQTLGRELDRLAASLVDAVIAGIAAEGSQA